MKHGLDGKRQRKLGSVWHERKQYGGATPSKHRSPHKLNKRRKRPAATVAARAKVQGRGGGM